MKKIAKFAFDTAFGPFVVWCGAALLLFAAIVMSSLFGKLGTAIVNVMLVVQVAAALVGVAAFIVSLAAHQFGRALGQFFLGIAGLLLFCMGLAASTFASWSLSVGNPTCGPARIASVTNETAALAFAVEYRPAHPFLAEYDKCIVFPSGKRIGVWMDTGGAGAFAVYRLPTGEYYLVDGLEHDFIRSDYRVNVTNETVEMMCDDKWFEIPDGALAVTCYSNMGVTIKTADGEKSVNDDGISVGDSLKGRIYLGLLSPRGDFEPGEGDPFADIVEPKWNPVKLDTRYGKAGIDGEVPFSLECKRWKGSHFYRLAFASGARVELGYNIGSGDGGYSLYALDDGRYHLVEVRETEDDKWRKKWRIDAAGETVHAVDSDPVGDSPSGARFIGTFHAPDDAPRPSRQKR